MPFHTDIRFVYEIIKNGLQEIKDLEKNNIGKKKIRCNRNIKTGIFKNLRKIIKKNANFNKKISQSSIYDIIQSMTQTS